MKGQLFMSDLLASILIVTIITAFITWELDQIYSRGSDLEYEKISSIAEDVAQMAVKNTLAKRSGETVLPNWIDPTRWDLLKTEVSGMILPPYGYEISESTSTLSAITSSVSCDSKQNMAVVRRIVYLEGVSGEFPTLTVKVCA